jgi:hypothetical protein
LSLARHAKKRDAGERGIIDMLEGRGYAVEALGDAPFDLLVTRAGRLWLLEVKSRLGRLTPRQVAFRLRFPVYVVRNGVEALAACSTATAKPLQAAKVAPGRVLAPKPARGASS